MCKVCLMRDLSVSCEVFEDAKSPCLMLEDVNVGKKFFLFFQLVCSFVRKPDVLWEYHIVRKFLIQNVELTVQELTSVTIRTVGRGMELGAKFGFVIRG